MTIQQLSGVTARLARAAATAVAFASVASTASAQELPTIVHIESVIYHLPIFAGRYVEMPQVIIERVVSPYAFVALATGHSASDPGRVLVVLHAPPAQPLPVGAVIEMFGRPYTMAGAQRLAAWPRDAIQENTVDDFEDLPVLFAELLRMPGAIELYRRPTAVIAPR